MFNKEIWVCPYWLLRFGVTDQFPVSTTCSSDTSLVSLLPNYLHHESSGAEYSWKWRLSLVTRFSGGEVSVSLTSMLHDRRIVIYKLEKNPKIFI